MKTLVLTAALCVALSGPASAQIIGSVVAPRDNPEVRRSLAGCPETTNLGNRCVDMRSQAEEYNSLIDTRLLPLKIADAAKCFGPVVVTTPFKSSDPFSKGYTLPDDLVTPIFAPSMFMRSGLAPSNPADDKRHTDLHAIGDLGYVEIYYGIDGEDTETALLYFRADKSFVPLKSTTDFNLRLKWDQERLGLIGQWFDQHLGTIKDLGAVEVSEAQQTSLNLGKDKTCCIKTEISHAPTVTNDWYSLTLNLESPEGKRTLYESVDRTNKVIGFLVDGEFFQMTPKLKKGAMASFAKQSLDFDPASVSFGMTVWTNSDYGLDSPPTSTPWNVTAPDILWMTNKASATYNNRFTNRVLRYGFRDGRLVMIRISISAIIPVQDQEAFERRRKELLRIQDEFRKAELCQKRHPADADVRIQYGATCSPSRESLVLAEFQITPVERKNAP